MATKIQLRRDSYANWQSANPLLAQGEFGCVISGTDTGKFKIGDGVTLWNDLLYATDTSEFTGILASTNGGTGVSNNGTITVSGNTTIGSSTNTVALSTTANTAVTLPTTGTLATRAGAEQLTNKTFGSNSYSTTQTLTTANDIVFLTASAAWTLTLPTPTAGKILHLIRTDGGPFVISISGHINGNSSATNTTWFPSTSINRRVTLASNGTSWYAIFAGTAAS